MYADDIALLATSCAQMTRMVEEVRQSLSLIGLRLSPQKSQILVGPRVVDREVKMQDVAIRQVDAFVYLGIFMGFTVSCMDVITHRVTRAVAAFHGFYRILGRVGKDIRTRLRLFHVFVTSKQTYGTHNLDNRRGNNLSPFRKKRFLEVEAFLDY